MPQFARRLVTARHVPPRVPPHALSAIVLLFAVSTFVRGLDYAFADAPAGGSLVVLDALGSIQLWGWLLVAVAVNLWLSYLVFRVHLLVFVAHVLAGSLYAGMVVAIYKSGTLASGPAPILVPLFAWAWHFVVGYVVKPFPPRCGTAAGARRGV